MQRITKLSKIVYNTFIPPKPILGRWGIEKKNFIIPNVESISHVRRGFLSAESQKRSSPEVEKKQSSNKKNWKRINYKKAIISAGMSCSKVIKKS